MPTATKDKGTVETPSSDAPDAASNSEPADDGFVLDVVSEIPTIARGPGGGERDTEFKRFYAALTAKPVGTMARFKSGVYSPNYGGDGAKAKYPLVRMASRQTGVEKGTGKDGADRKVFDIFGTHVGPEPEAAEGDSIV